MASEQPPPLSWADDDEGLPDFTAPKAKVPVPATTPAVVSEVAPEIAPAVGPAADTKETPSTEEDDKPPGGGLVDSSYEVAVTLADMQGDPNSPLYSVKSFQDLGLPDNLMKGIYSMRFSHPSKIQERALPLLMADPPTNFIGQSQSGTGKTASFVLNILKRINMDLHAPQAIILTPSRELARQILTVVQTMGEFTSVTTQFAVPQIMQKGEVVSAQVIVGTPGTINDIIRRRLLPVDKLICLTVDEADNMLDQQGLGDQCRRVRREMPPGIQIVLFSATFPEKVMEFANVFAPNANKISLKVEELTVKGIKQVYMDVNGDEAKYEVILKMYELMTVGSSVIFVKRRDTASELERRMVEDGHPVVSLHGAYDGASRDKVIDDFRFGRAKVLITTNVLARGIDVATTSLVVNYDIPVLADGKTPDFETYLHRIGRTGRFGRVGISISFVHDRESWEQMAMIQNHFQCEVTRISTESWDTVEAGLEAILRSKKAMSRGQQRNGVGAAF